MLCEDKNDWIVFITKYPGTKVVRSHFLHAKTLWKLREPSYDGDAHFLWSSARYLQVLIKYQRQTWLIVIESDMNGGQTDVAVLWEAVNVPIVICFVDALSVGNIKFCKQQCFVCLWVFRNKRCCLLILTSILGIFWSFVYINNHIRNNCHILMGDDPHIAMGIVVFNVYFFMLMHCP